MLNCICDFHLQQDVRWWGEVERPRLCLAFLPGASFLTSCQGRCPINMSPLFSSRGAATTMGVWAIPTRQRLAPRSLVQSGLSGVIGLTALLLVVGECR